MLIGLSPIACETQQLPPDDTADPVDQDQGNDQGNDQDNQAPNQPTCDVTIDTTRPEFNLATFRQSIVPMTTGQACASCHAAGTGDNAGAFSVWANAATDDCDFAKQFNELINKGLVDLSQTVEDTRLHRVLVNPERTHPGGKVDPASADILTAYLQDAKDVFDASLNPGVDQGDANASPWNIDVYSNTVNVLLDNPAESPTCSQAGCHGSGVAGFTLNNGAQAGTPEMEANFNAVTALANPSDPEESLVYFKATNAHSGSNILRGEQAEALLTWLSDVNEIVDPNGCVSADSFNLAAFSGDILPIMFGDVDLNDQANPNNQGCALQACHGDESRAGGALIISENRSAAENLAAFSCFVNIQNPPNSQILTCPSDNSACPIDHPGAAVFDDFDDANYDRILGFLLGAAGAQTPLDYGFFATFVNVQFDDLSIIENGSNLTCANGGCHGVAGQGQAAPGGSNFPIIAGSGGNRQATEINFAAASGFTNFIQPEAASMFLYPTNEIANADNPFASGLAHPGGEIYDINSESAQNILRWAGGLRADVETQGAVLDWLIFGEFAGDDIQDEVIRNEESVFASFEDDFGGEDLGGEAVVITGEPGNAVIDLDVEFGEADAPRTVFATAYIVNLSNGPIFNAELVVSSPNDVRIYVDEQIGGQVAAGNEGSAFMTLQPFAETGETVRVMLKLFQDPDVSQDLQFEARLQDDNGVPLDANDARVVIKLSQEDQ